MSVRHEIRNGVLIIRVEGHEDRERVAAGFAAALSDDALRPGTPLVIDSREAESARPVDELRELVSRLARLKDRIAPRIAVVVARPAQYGMSRMTSVFMEEHGLELEILSDLDEAVARLQL